jgi:two-component system, chemotaxis family, sensor kinase Cph1
MEQVLEFFKKLFLAESWPPRWLCGTWSDFHGWLYILSDLAIWAAYFTIPLILFYFIQKRKRDLPFIRVFWLFILFILACGTTHLVDAMLFYYPAYRLSGLVLFATAIISWVTIFGLIKVFPDALNLKSPSQLGQIIDERTSELTKLSEDLVHHNTQLSNFADITTHNLRSPASNLISLLDLYEKETDKTAKELYFQKFRESATNLMRTIDDLYEVVKIKKDINIKRETLRFEAVLIDVLMGLSADIEKNQAVINYDFKASPRIKYPKAYLESIFLNLVSNALKYRLRERKPVITFQTTEREGHIIFTCTDNGLGLDMKKYGDKVFKLHQTFHENKDARGMGLFLIRSQIEMLGGHISMESTVNTGSVFTITFKDAALK